MVNVGKSAGDFFQSDAQVLAARVRELKRSNTLGSPLSVPSKVLALVHFSTPLALGQLFLVADAGQAVRVVDYQTGSTTATFKGHTGPVTSVVYYHDNAANDTFILSGSWDKSIRIWSFKTRALVRILSGHSDYVKSLLVVPEKTLVYSGSTDATIRRTDMITGACSLVLKGHTRAVEDLALCEDKLRLWSCSSDGSIRLWNVTTGACLTTLNCHDTSIYQLYLDNDDGEETLWSASADRNICHWTTANVVDITLTHPDFVRCVLPIDQGAYVITGCRDEKIRIWNITDERIIKEIDGHYDDITALVLVGDAIFSASLDATIRRWSIKDLLDVSVQYRVDVTASLDNETENNIQQVDTRISNTITEEEEAELSELMMDS